MAGNTIEAKLRIAADVAQAIASLKSVREELLATNRAAAGAGGAGKAGGGRGAGAAAAQDTAEVVGQLKRRTNAEREAAAETKRLAKEEADAKKAAAREAKKLADEEDRRQKKAQRAAELLARQQADAEKRAQRAQAYKGAALAPQLNDVFVGLTTGQSPLQVALQQGPQITQIYGGVANTFRTLLGVLSPLRLVLGGVAAGFAAMALGAAAGDRESSQLRKTLALTGNAAGTSLGQINSLAQGISEGTKTSIGFVRDVLAQVINLSGQTDTTLGATTRAVTALAQLTGQSAEEAVKGFESQAEGASAWAQKQNRAYNFLTAQQLAYIRSLERQGRVAEAIKFTNEKLADTLTQRGAAAIGLIERGWNAAGRAVSFFVDQLKSIGRDDTAEQRLASLQTKLAEIDARIAQRQQGGTPNAGRRNTVDLANRQRLVDQIAAVNREQVRKSESAAALREEQDRIKREAKEFQSILAAQDLAAAQKSLAQKEAALDAEAALVQRAYAQELLSANDQALRLNAIEQRRAQAQEALAQRALEIEQARTPSLETKNETEAQQATLTQLEAQVVAAKARLASAVSEGRRLIDAEVQRLDEEMRRRNAANASTDALRQNDPQRRANLEARAATDAARKEFDDLERDIRSRQETARQLGDSTTINSRLEAVLGEARKSLDELTRRSKLESFARQATELNDKLALEERALDALVEQGALTTEEAEQRKFQARSKALPQLKLLLQLQQALAQTPEEKNAIQQLVLDLDELSVRMTETERTMRGSFKSGLADFFNSVFTGAKKADDAVKDFVVSVARSMLNLIAQKWAEKLTNSLFGINWSGFGTSTPSSAGTTTAQVRHSGGTVGSGIRSVARAVSPLVFAGAQVLHSGGLAGLKSNEVPAILEAGEEALREDNPRHVKNFRGNGISVQSTYIFQGAGGTPEDQKAAGDELDRRIRGTVEQWWADNSRQGGKLSGGRRG